MICSYVGNAQVLGMTTQPNSQQQQSSSSSSHHHHNHTSNAAAASAAVAGKIWACAHTLSCMLLHDSLPCMKRCKRPITTATTAAAKKLLAKTTAPPPPEALGSIINPVDVAACINVLYGTLLKLYPLGAKVPTFKARVAMTTRLMALAGLSTTEQQQFLADHPSLVRICFMEYSLNALEDWLPCERQLLLKASACNSRQQQPMQGYNQAMGTYLRIAGSMCDIFR